MPKLLGDGGRPGDGLAALVVLPEGTHDGEDIITRVAVKFLVFCCNGGGHQVGRDILELGIRPPAGIWIDDLIEQVAIAIENANLYEELKAFCELAGIKVIAL